VERLVIAIKAAAMRKQEVDIIDLVIRSSQITAARVAP
jgi:hypothetical protein